jgi:protein-disulfide isomerase
MRVLFVILFFVANLASAAVTDYGALYQNPDEVRKILTPGADELYLGKEDAPITIIEYSSLSCHHCGDFQRNVFPQMKENYIDTGKLKYIHRDFPMDLSSSKASTLIHCADKNQFFTFLKILFEKQSNWVSQKNYLEILENIGKLGGMSGDRIQKCFADKDLENKILNERLEAIKIVDKDGNASIGGTPTFFINGEKLTKGHDYKSLSEKFDSMLK